MGTDRPKFDERQTRIDLAAAFRWTARLRMHEAVANHFSLAIDGTGTRFLINPNQMHFSRIRASDLIVVDASDATTLDRKTPQTRLLGGFTAAFTVTVATLDASCMCTRPMPRC